MGEERVKPLADLVERQLELLPLVCDDESYTWAFVCQAWRIIRHPDVPSRIRGIAKASEAKLSPSKQISPSSAKVQQGTRDKGEAQHIRRGFCLHLRVIAFFLWRRFCRAILGYVAICSVFIIYAYFPNRYDFALPLAPPYNHIVLACTLLYLICYLFWRLLRGALSTPPLVQAYEVYLQQLKKSQ